MKQTLILLAALAAASATAAEPTWTELDNVTLSYQEELWGESSYFLDALTFDFCITSDSLSEGKTILAYVSTLYEEGGYESQISFTLEKVEDSYSLRAGLTNLTTDASDLFGTLSGSITGLQENVVYTLSTCPNEGSSYATLTLTGSDGSSFKTITIQNYLWKPGTVTDAVISADAAMVNAAFAVSVSGDEPVPTPAVPEPTTATLSLLALAGLTARRRRK